jgi:cellulose biosynthesis protein BcsQ
MSIKRKKSFAIVNQKEGTGKISVSSSLSAELAKHKFKTLLIDLDPEHNANLSLEN